MQKLLPKLTESDINLHFPVRLENLTVLKLRDMRGCNLPQINNILKKGKVPNLTELDISGKFRDKVRLGKFLDELDPYKAIKLVKLALTSFIISAEELGILSEKLTDIQLTELGLSYSSGLTGNLSVLFTHSFPRLNTLILSGCGLNATDLQNLARASVEGKLPQLRHLNISHNGENIRALFTHSAQWNQLKTLVTSDGNILNVEPECLISLELILWRSSKQPRSVTRRWLCLKVIGVLFEDCADCVADGVERGMFPSLTTVRYYSRGYGRPFFFKLLKANISVEPGISRNENHYSPN